MTQAMIAYLMQLVIVFIIWLIVRVLQVFPKCIQYVYCGKKHRRLTASLKEKLSRHQSIAKSILVDFQEAQCFFVICISYSDCLLWTRYSIRCQKPSPDLCKFQRGCVHIRGRNPRIDLWFVAVTQIPFGFDLYIGLVRDQHCTVCGHAILHIFSAADNRPDRSSFRSRAPG